MKTKNIIQLFSNLCFTVTQTVLDKPKYRIKKENKTCSLNETLLNDGYVCGREIFEVMAMEIRVARSLSLSSFFLSPLLCFSETLTLKILFYYSMAAMERTVPQKAEA